MRGASLQRDNVSEIKFGVYSKALVLGNKEFSLGAIVEKPAGGRTCLRSNNAGRSHVIP